MLEQVVGIFAERAPGDIAALRDAVGRTDLPEVARAAHRLKGSCAAVGATAMAALLAEIETDARADRGESLAEAVGRVERSFAETRGALDGLAPLTLAEARPV